MKKYIDNFKRKSRFTTDEEEARLEILAENSDPEDCQAIISYGHERESKGFDTGVLWSGICLAGSWVGLKVLNYFMNRKNHD